MATLRWARPKSLSPIGPAACRAQPRGQRRARSMDQLSAKVAVAPLADPEQLRFAAGRELTRDEAKPGRKIAPSIEALRADGGDKRGRDDRADPGMSPVGERLRSPSPSRRTPHRRLRSVDRSAHCARASATSRTIAAQSRSACSSISMARNCSSFRLPCGATNPRSSRIARN